MSVDKKRETTDEIIQEIRRIKETLAESMNFDIDQIIDDAMRKQHASGRKILSPPARQGG